MPPQPSTVQSLRAENAGLRARLEEAEEILRAIRAGEVDALVTEGDAGPQIFTLQGLDADQNRLRGEMLAQVADAVLAVDTEDRVTFLNAAAERQYGVRADGVLGRKLAEVFTRRWPSPGHEAEMQRGLSERALWRGELIHRRADGCEFPVEVSIALLHGADGECRGRVTTIRDVTGRKQLEQEKEESLRLLDMLLTLAPVGFVFLDLDLRFVRINERLAEMNGLSIAAHVGRTVAEILPTLEPGLREVTARILATGQPVLDHEFAGETLLAPGVKRHWRESWYPVRYGRGEIIGFGAVVEEISERKRAEQALRESGENYRALAVASSEVAYRMSADWSTMLLLDGRRLVASSDQPLAAWEWLDQNIPPDEHPRVRQAISEAIARKSLFELEHRVRRPDGSIGWTLSRAVPILDENEEVIAWFGAAGDITSRKEAQAALLASERQLRLALEAGATGLWAWDMASNVITWSPECYAIHGMKEGEFDGTAAGFDRLLDPLDRSGVWATVRAAVEGRTRYECEFRIVRPDGSVRWVAHTGRADYDEQGRLLLVLGTIMDITERRRIEQDLRAGEERFRLSLQGSNVIIAQCDLDLRYVWIHDPRPGFDAHSVIGKRDTEILDNEGTRQLERLKQTVVETRAEAGGEFTFPQSDGPLWYQIRAEPRFDPSGTLEGVSTVAMNITEFKRVEETLRRSEARLSGILRQSPAGIVQADAAGCMTLINQRWCEMLGYSEAELLGRSIIEITHPSSVASTVAAFGRLAAGEPDFQIETAYCRKDGSVFHAQSNVAAILSPAGDILGLIAVVLDISERLRSDEELRRLAEELSEAGSRKDEFLATLAHELRNPLAAVRSAVQVIRLRGSAAQPELEGVHDMIDRQSGHMVRLIDDLMDVSRVTSGKVALKRQTVDLVNVVREASAIACAAYADRHHDVRVNLPDRELKVNGDPLRLAQIVSNVLNNSFRYTDVGGKVEVSLGRDGEDGDRAILRVRDNGIGIAASMLPRVFEAFTQADTSLDRAAARTGGLGIGLALVKSLVEQHGGSIEACSEGLGKGSEFVVRLPALLADEPDAEHPPTIMPAATDEFRGDASGSVQNPAARSVRSPRAPRVLVVDDNVDLAKCVALLLEFNGYDTHMAHDGREAVEQAVLLEPDLILLDIGLPRLNGYEACRAIRQRLRRHPPVMVALTGWGQDGDRQKSREAGFDGHLVKPVDNATLHKVLPEFLAKRPSSTEPLADDSAPD